MKNAEIEVRSLLDIKKVLCDQISLIEKIEKKASKIDQFYELQAHKRALINSIDVIQDYLHLETEIYT